MIRQGTRTQSFSGIKRALGAFAMALVLVAGFGGSARADVFDPFSGSGPVGSLSVSAGALTINTDTLTMSGAATATGEDDGGVAVFRFNNVSVTGGTVTVTGSRPLAIVSAGDLTWSVALDASGAVAGRLGGGVGGAAGVGATSGGVGGAGGTGAGVGGSGGGLGRGAGRDGQPQFNGEAGGNRGGSAAGADGSPGSAGSVGGSGGAGSLGFNGAGVGGAAGGGGTAGAASGTAANGGAAQNPGGGGGSGGAGAVNANASQGTVPTAGAAGNTGSAGNSGGNAGSGDPGGNGTFTVPANTFLVAGGTGGGGGGGGGKGGGGQGGGQGSGGSGGGGGGGGGGMDGQHNCGTSTDGLGGSGGAGGNGGTGGNGGVGGSAPNGASGGAGSNGGGAVVLATRGLLNFTGVVDISAGAVNAGGASPGQNAGGVGVAGATGAAGQGVTQPATGGTWQFLQGIYCTGNGAANGAAGRAGANGGTGGTGGVGGSSGISGAGGSGGRGTPGMVKLQGSVVLASTGVVTAANAAGAAADANGKLTLISNLNAPLGQTPVLGGASTVVGTLGNIPVLTGPNSFDANPNHPYIGQLTGASPAATEGILQGTFWNKPQVDAVAASQRLQLITLGPADTAAGFAGFDQIFLRNNSADTLTNVFINVAGGGPVLIPTSTPGTLAPGEIFTTTVATGASVGITSALTFSNPSNQTVNVGNPASFSTTVSASNGTALYQWQVSTGGPFTDLPGENGPTLTLPPTSLAQNGNQYRVLVEDNTNGPTASAPATLTVVNAANITTQPQGAELYTTENYTITVVVQGGTGVYNYTWFFDNGGGPVTAPFNSNSPNYTIPSATLAEQGAYTVFIQEVGGAGATLTSNPANIVIVPQVQIDQNPVGGHGNTGNPFNFTVVASGGKNPLSYQWFFLDGVNPAAPVGTNSPTLNIPSLALSNAGQYFVTVSDAGTSSATSTNATLTVTDLLTVALTDPTPTGVPGVQASSTNLKDVYNNGSITLSVTVSGGTPPYTYNWQIDQGVGFGPVSGTNGNPTYTDAAMTFLDAGTYRCTVSDSSPDPNVSASIVVGVFPPLTLNPTTPANTTVNVTQIANFNVLPTGGIPPLTYNWRRNTASLGAPSQDTLAFGPVLLANSGDQFDVIVTDAVGVAPNGQQTSVSATLTVTNNIGVNLGADLTAYTDDMAVISALVAGGNGNYDYAWTLNGNPVVNGGNITGADSDTLTIAGPALAQGGTYALTVSDDSGVNAPDTDSLVLSVFERTTVGGPADVSVFVGDNAVFSVGVSSGGIAPFGYDWREGGLSLGAPNQPTLTIPGVTLGDDGRQFDVVVTESASDFSAGIPVTSVEATLNVREALTVTDPVPASVAAYTTDAPFQLEVTPANGYGPPYTYQWFIIVPLLGPVPAPGFNANPQTVSPAAIASVVGTGFFDVFVVVGDGVGQATSGTSTLEIAEPLEITDGLEDDTAAKGTQYTWSITVNGGLTPVTYSWTVDDGSKAPQVIPGADGPSYTTPTLTELGELIYEVTVEDGGGSSVSSSATLTVVLGVPAAGLLGLSLLTVAGALGGAALLRRRRD